MPSMTSKSKRPEPFGARCCVKANEIWGLNFGRVWLTCLREFARVLRIHGLEISRVGLRGSALRLGAFPRCPRFISAPTTLHLYLSWLASCGRVGFIFIFPVLPTSLKHRAIKVDGTNSHSEKNGPTLSNPSIQKSTVTRGSSERQDNDRGPLNGKFTLYSCGAITARRTRARYSEANAYSA